VRHHDGSLQAPLYPPVRLSIKVRNATQHCTAPHLDEITKLALASGWHGRHDVALFRSHPSGWRFNPKAPTVAEMMRDQVGAQTRTQGPGWGFGYGWGVLADKRQAETPQSEGTIQ
jgi:hypothetical protein